MYEIILKSKRYVYVAFTCEQTIEKLVKALHVLYTGNEAPKSHNILYLFELIFKNDEYYKKINNFQKLKVAYFYGWAG